MYRIYITGYGGKHGDVIFSKRFAVRGCLANGDFVIIALEETKQGSFADLPEAAQKQAWRALSRVQGESEGNAFLSALREQAVIQIPESSDQ